MSITIDQLYPNSSSNYSLLWEKNEERAITLIPSMIFIGVLMITGLVGNILVLYIFLRYFKRSVMNFLFLVLATLDLLSCSLAMPFAIVDIRYGYTFSSEPVCKGFRFLVAFPNINSVFVLLLIALYRHRKICRPLANQMDKTDAKKSVMCSTICAVLLSLPSVYLYGLRRLPVDSSGLHGRTCTIRDSKTVSFYSLLYHAFGTSIIIIISVALIYLYIAIWLTVRRHSQNLCLTYSNSPSSNTELTITNSAIESESTNLNSAIENSSRRTVKGGFVTRASFLVSLLFIISNFPIALSMIIRNIWGPPDYSDNPAFFAVYCLLIRSYFISSVGNPIIYGFMSKTFRSKCYNLFVRFHDTLNC